MQPHLKQELFPNDTIALDRTSTGAVCHHDRPSTKRDLFTLNAMSAATGLFVRRPTVSLPNYCKDADKVGAHLALLDRAS